MTEFPHASLKRCAKCEQFFPPTLDFFYSSKGSKSSRDGLYPRCKTCVQSARRKRPITPEGYKRCPTCKEVLSKDEFYVCQTRPDGVASICKSCQHNKQLRDYAKAKGQERETPETMTCGRCGKTKPATLQSFMMNPLCRYGLNTICRTCTNDRQIELNHRDPEKNHAKWRAHYQTRTLYYELRYQTKREHILAKQRAFNLKNPKIVLEWKRKYAKSDRGHEIGRAKENRRRAHKASAPGSFTPEDIQDQHKRQKGKCYYCHKKVGSEYHVDHVMPLSRGGSNDPSNLVVSCQSCNCSKKDKFLHEWAQGERLI